MRSGFPIKQYLYSAAYLFTDSCERNSQSVQYSFLFHIYWCRIAPNNYSTFPDSQSHIGVNAIRLTHRNRLVSAQHRLIAFILYSFLCGVPERLILWGWADTYRHLQSFTEAFPAQIPSLCFFFSFFLCVSATQLSGQKRDYSDIIYLG